MKFYLCVVFFVGISMFSNAGDTKDKIVYRKLSYSEKILKEYGLMFKLTFDKGLINPDFANGASTPVKGSDIQLKLRGMRGFDDAGAFKIEKGESLEYPAVGNIDHRKGTIIFWVKAENYSPKDIKKSDKNLCHKAYIYVKFKNGKEWVKFFFYQYYEKATGYFFWQNSYPKTMGKYRVCPIALDAIEKGEWFQIVATWDEKELKTFLNGKLQGKISLPPKVKKTLKMKPVSTESTIALRKCILEPMDSKMGKNTVLDDISIYDYPMSELEVRKRYLALVSSVEKIDLPNVSLAFNGVDYGNGDLREMQVAMNFYALSEKFRNSLKGGALKSTYELIHRETGAKTTGEWQLKKITEFRTLQIDSGGEYIFTLKLVAPDGKTEKVRKEFKVPDLSFAGNQLGKDCVVPKPWSPVKLSSSSYSSNTLSIWNRKYYFRQSPFPVKIDVDGKNLLKHAPKLIITTVKGVEKIKYEMIKRRVTDAKAIFYGKGSGSDFTIEYKTTVEYDGLINCEFTINGSPEIVSMKVCWTVNPRFDKYFLSPVLNHDRKGEYEFPGVGWRCLRQLWIVSEEGGFCWAPSSDANWVFEPGQKILKVNRKADGAFCEIDIINKKVKLPPSTPYQVLFIATPTRPAPKEQYSIQMGYKKKLLSCRGQGQTAFGEFAPDPIDYPKLVKNRPVNSVAMFNFASGLTDSSLTGRYFRKYWGNPIDYVYSMNFLHRGKNTPTQTISCCPTTTYSDFILKNIEKLFDHEYGDRIWAIYYDLCGINSCTNELHGCSFKDKFGRRINKSNLLGLREHLKRTTAYCHSRGRKTIYHAQNVFNPLVHGFADYWFGGEQLEGMLNRNRFAYCDDISDDIYRSEFNTRILGSTLLCITELHDKSCTDDATFSLFTQMLIQDITTSTNFNKRWIAVKVYKILDKYDLDNAIAKRYYEQNSITSSNQDIRITYYICKKNKYLVVLGNTTKKEQTGIIDFSKLKSGDYQAQAEFKEKRLNVKDGKLKVIIPARMFMLIGI